MFVQVNRGQVTGPQRHLQAGQAPGKARHRGDGGRMSCRELLVDVPARECLKGAVTALVWAVLAAGTAVRPLGKS